MMLQVKDPAAIKLFGKTIPFCYASVAVDYDPFGSSSSSGGLCSDNERGSSDGSEIGVKEMDKVSESQTVKGLKQRGEDGFFDGSNENQKMVFVTEGTVNTNAGSSYVTEETDSNERHVLKKPDKLLPCPRCNSMDTKFCYYNNYNVLQPRHFCKGCQRYWTAGGAMRNVPVGAGRRKSKNDALQNRYLTISEVLHTSNAGSSNGFLPCQPGLKCGSATISESTGSMSNVTQIQFLDPSRDLTQKADGVVTKSSRVGEINSSSSCVTATNETECTQQGFTPLLPSLRDSLSQIPCIPAWPYPWNAAIAPPAFPHPGFVLPFVPPNYWPNTAIPITWNAPWLASQSPSQTSEKLKPPVLGKHSRDDVMIPNNKSREIETAKKPTVLTPKTLRIDHPEEAAKSSIWETLGIKNETISKGSIFRDFKSKEADTPKNACENYTHLTSNPAALSRSLNFQELYSRSRTLISTSLIGQSQFTTTATVINNGSQVMINRHGHQKLLFIKSVPC